MSKKKNNSNKFFDKDLEITVLLSLLTSSTKIKKKLLKQLSSNSFGYSTTKEAFNTFTFLIKNNKGSLPTLQQFGASTPLYVRDLLLTQEPIVHIEEVRTTINTLNYYQKVRSLATFTSDLIERLNSPFVLLGAATAKIEKTLKEMDMVTKHIEMPILGYIWAVGTICPDDINCPFHVINLANSRGDARKLQKQLTEEEKKLFPPDKYYKESLAKFVIRKISSYDLETFLSSNCTKD